MKPDNFLLPLVGTSANRTPFKVLKPTFQMILQKDFAARFESKSVLALRYGLKKLLRYLFARRPVDIPSLPLASVLPTPAAVLSLVNGAFPIVPPLLAHSDDLLSPQRGSH